MLETPTKTVKMSEKSSNKSHIAGPYAVSLVSIMLVLFLLGAFACFMMYVRNLSNHFKENIGFEIVMNSNVNEDNILRLKNELDSMPAVMSTEYITPKEALSRLSKDLGEDFVKWLGNEENPLLPSIDVRFHSAYANTDSIAVVENFLRNNPDVSEVCYQKSLVDDINNNVRKIAVVLTVVSVVLLLIAIALIRNTIRLSIYSKRFLVRSMQLVGATESFIRRPFLRQGVSQGFFGGLLADIFLVGILYAVTQRVPDLMSVQDTGTLAAILVGIVVLGILLAWCSTRAAVDKFLKADLDKLYN